MDLFLVILGLIVAVAVPILAVVCRRLILLTIRAQWAEVDVHWIDVAAAVLRGRDAGAFLRAAIRARRAGLSVTPDQLREHLTAGGGTPSGSPPPWPRPESGGSPSRGTWRPRWTCRGRKSTPRSSAGPSARAAGPRRAHPPGNDTRPRG